MRAKTPSPCGPNTQDVHRGRTGQICGAGVFLPPSPPLPLSLLGHPSFIYGCKRWKNRGDCWETRLGQRMSERDLLMVVDQILGVGPTSKKARERVRMTFPLFYLNLLKSQLFSSQRRVRTPSLVNKHSSTPRQHHQARQGRQVLRCLKSVRRLGGFVASSWDTAGYVTHAQVGASIGPLAAFCVSLTSPETSSDNTLSFKFRELTHFTASPDPPSAARFSHLDLCPPSLRMWHCINP